MILLVGVMFVILLCIELVMQNILDEKKQLQIEKHSEKNILEWFFKNLCETKPEKIIILNH